MTLPFSHAEFLDVFGAYNALLWPAALLLWIATVGSVVAWLRGGRLRGPMVLGLLAVHWAWSGVAYHWAFFRGINPAASVFAALFTLQALLFTWCAFGSRGYAQAGFSARGVIGRALVVFGLVYPLVGLGLGLQYPRLPLFAVPCPTTLITAGLLLTTVGVPRLVNIVPMVWAAIGSSAAFALGIHADLALVVAAVMLVVDTFVPSVLGPKA